MKIEISDSIIAKTGLDGDDLLLALAIQLFSDERLSLKEATMLSGKNAVAFERELDNRKIPLHNDFDKLATKRRVLDKFGFRDTIK